MWLPKRIGLPLVGVDLAPGADVGVGRARHGRDRHRLLALAFSQRVQFPSTASTACIEYRGYCLR